MQRPVVAIFLAAGAGRRFAAASNGDNKLLAVLSTGLTVVEQSLNQFTGVADEIIAVVNATDAAVIPYLRRKAVRIVVAPDAALGMGHSLAAGARAALDRFPHLCGAMIGLADMPWVNKTTIAAVQTALRERETSATWRAVRPTRSGEHGHPVGIIAPQVFIMQNLIGDAGLRTILQSPGATHFLKIDDQGSVADIDLPDDIGKTLRAL